MYFAYILRCSDGSCYVGHTDDLEARLARHNRGAGGAFTAQRLPVTLVYSEAQVDLRSAINRERQLKRWTRAKKEALIAGNLELLKVL